MALISSIPSPVQHIRGAGRGSVHAAAPDTTTWQITHFLCSSAGVRLDQEDNGADGEDNECNGERTDAGLSQVL